MSGRLTIQSVKAAQAQAKRYTLWDAELRGFGLRVNADGTKTYLLKYRFQQQQRWHTIGKHGSPWTPDLARKEALRMLAQARNGVDPAEAKQAASGARLTVAELCDLYMDAARTGQVLTKFDEPKKASTVLTDASRIERHIKPLLGKRRVLEVTSEHVEALLHDIAGGKTALDVKTGVRGRAIVRGGQGAATRTVGLLGGIFAFAVRRRLRQDNPVQGVQRFRDKRNERFLSTHEIQRLGKVLAASDEAWRQHAVTQRAWEEAGSKGKPPRPAAGAEHASATNAIRLLLLTGARKSEVLKLQWSHVDHEHGYLRLPTSKTGAKAIPAGSAAFALIKAQPRLANNPHVFPGSVAGQPFVGLTKVWERIRERAELPGVRIHDLRHSFGSVGASSGNSLPLLGAILGHRDPRTTQRYAHVARDPARAAAEQVSEVLAGLMEGGGKVDQD